MDLDKIKISFLILKKAGIKRLIIKIISYLDTRISLFFFRFYKRRQKIFITKRILNKQSYDFDSLDFNSFICNLIVKEYENIDLIIVPDFLKSVFSLSFCKYSIKILAYSDFIENDISAKTIFIIHIPMLNQIIKARKFCDSNKTLFSNSSFVVKNNNLVNYPIVKCDVIWPNKFTGEFLNRFGMKFYIRNNTMDLNIIEEVQNEYIEWMELNIQNKLNTIIDIGGHIGSFSLLSNKFLNKNGRQLVFEPVPENFNLIKKNVYLNNLNDFIKPFNCAVSNKSGTAKIFISSDNTGGSRLDMPDPSSKTFEVVKVTTLEEITKVNKINFIDLIKIDVEGSEHSIVLSSKKILINKAKYIICEAGGSYAGNANDVLDFFKNNQFEVSYRGNEGLMLIFAINKNFL